jgi:hypothetical protein
MMKELKAIRGLLNTRPAERDWESGGAIDRVAAITLDELGVQLGVELGAASPAPTEETVHL